MFASKKVHGEVHQQRLGSQAALDQTKDLPFPTWFLTWS